MNKNNDNHEIVDLEISEINEDSLKSAGLSKYRSDSNKTQPELISVYFEKDEIDDIHKWLNQIEKQSTKERVEIQSLYILGFAYLAEGEQIERHKELAYAKNQIGEVFVQAITDQQFLDIDDFKDEDLKLLEKRLNHKWFKATTLKFIDPLSI